MCIGWLLGSSSLICSISVYVFFWKLLKKVNFEHHSYVDFQLKFIFIDFQLKFSISFSDIEENQFAYIFRKIFKIWTLCSSHSMTFCLFGNVAKVDLNMPELQIALKNRINNFHISSISSSANLQSICNISPFIWSKPVTFLDFTNILSNANRFQPF